MSDHSPALSVVVLARRGLNGYLGLLAHLARQRAARRIEVVVVASDDVAAAECTAYADSFARLRVVVDARVAVRGQGAAVAVRVASAPLVALTEDHSYPEPEWAERLIAAHEAGGWASVGPSIGFDHGSPVSTRYDAPFPFTGTLEQVVIQLVERAAPDAAAVAARAEMSRQ